MRHYQDELLARLGSTSQDEQTPLHVAVGLGHQGIARLLLDHGAARDAQNKVSRSMAVSRWARG